MIELSPDEFRAVIAEARLAPSVHNIQPSRWRLHAGKVTLYGDTTRSIPVADPNWRDWRLSLGAAFEGLVLALAQKGLTVTTDKITGNQAATRREDLESIVTGTLVALNGTRPKREPVEGRMSWRGAFKSTGPELSGHLDDLAKDRDDLLLVRDRPFIEHVARLADHASLHFLRDDAHRQELLYWMRLSPKHPRFALDGLNAQAMQLGSMEAYGAGIVLGSAFSAIDRAGLAPKLVGEYTKTCTASAIALLHRPAGEDTFASGRAFYRAWLAMERAGFKAVPMSVLADWTVARNALHRLHGLDADRFIVSAFRIGRPNGTLPSGHARLPVDALII